MKLLPSFLPAALGLIRGEMDPQDATTFAHMRVRDAFRTFQMDEAIIKQAEILDDAVVSQHTLKNFDIKDFVVRSENVTMNLRSGCDSSFPTIDGSCNHPKDKGMKMTSYVRLVAADYCDKQQTPRCAANGRALPEPRKVSLTMNQHVPRRISSDVSYSFTAWGQFLTHDIIQTPNVPGGNPCRCQQHPNCVNIDLANDPVLRFRCLFVIRSAGQLGNSNGRPTREQTNQLSAFIDGTTIYGVSTRHKNLLVDSDGMHLKMHRNARHGDFLPTVDEIRPLMSTFQTSVAFNDKNHPESVAGDNRVLENPVLTSFHTMFARLHNHAVDKLVALNPNWPKERVFEEARLFVMSVIKRINYDENLPVLLGPKGMNLVNNPGSGEPTVQPINGHTPPLQSDPTIRQEFATAAYRFGHAMVPEMLITSNSNLAQNEQLEMKDNYFDPDAMWTDGPGACLRGAMMGDTQEVNGHFAQSTMNNLFKPMNGAHGVDLLAINMARGRDHGLGTYIDVRNFCMRHPQYRQFFTNGQAPRMRQGWREILRHYNVERDVDLYIGFLMEEHIEGAQVGPTAACIIADQFIALKKGDRFHFDKPEVFSTGQSNEIKRIGLGKVMCEVMERTQQVTRNPFVKANAVNNGVRNDIVSCSQLGPIDFSAWKEGASGPDATPAPVTQEPVTPPPQTPASTTTKAPSTTTKATTTKAPPTTTKAATTTAPATVNCDATDCSCDPQLTFRLTGSGTFICNNLNTHGIEKRLCDMRCPEGTQPAGRAAGHAAVRAKIICFPGSGAWVLRGQKQADFTFGCEDRNGAPGTAPAVVTAAPVNPDGPCQIGDMRQHIMGKLRRKFPNTSYQFDQNDFKVIGQSGGGLLTITFDGVRGRDFNTRCRLEQNGRERWRMTIKVDLGNF